jgi:hypothetical protein
MSNLLDIANPASWPEEVLGLVNEEVTPENSDGILQELDCPGSNDPLATYLRKETADILRQGSGFLAYHSCRPLNASCYREKGLLVTKTNRLRELTEKVYGEVPGWEVAFEGALNIKGIQHYVDDWYGGTVGLGFTSMPYYCKGSFFLREVADQLREDGKTQWQDYKSKSQPTILVCNLPLSWLSGEETDGELLADYASELLRACIIHRNGGEYESSRAIHVCRDIPPEHIIEIRELKDSEICT